MRRLSVTNLDEQFRLLDTGAGERRFREDCFEHTSRLAGYLVGCAHCGQLISVRTEGRPPEFCSARCRQRAHRARRRTS